MTVDLRWVHGYPLASGRPVARARLRETPADFRVDEAAHRRTAFEHGAEQTPGYGVLTGAIKLACRLAIKVSEKI